MKYRIHVAGNLEGDLICHSLNSMCGDIVGGLGVRWEKNRFGFVLSFDDLEKLYLAAKKERSRSNWKACSL